jgi:hypothetical protein
MPLWLKVAPPLTVGKPPEALGAVKEPVAETTSVPVPRLAVGPLASDDAVPEAAVPPAKLNVVKFAVPPSK